MKNKYLTIIQNLDDVTVLKKNGIDKFLFPLKSFSVGFKKYFEINDIREENSYLFLNKLLDSSDLLVLDELLNNLPNNVKGIVFDDIGVLKYLNNLNIEKILFLNHFCTNVESVNEYLKFVDSLVLPYDITLEETNYILKNSDKSVCIYGYGHLNLSYSKRKFNTSYSEYHKVQDKDIRNITNTDFNFLVVQNENGSVIYDNKVYSGLNENYSDNVKYCIINLFNIRVSDFLDNKHDYKGFLDKKTIYRMKDVKASE